MALTSSPSSHPDQVLTLTRGEFESMLKFFTDYSFPDEFEATRKRKMSVLKEVALFFFNDDLRFEICSLLAFKTMVDICPL
jgi:hypothetical protein